LAWRFALAPKIQTHRQWALRAYLVSKAQWFTRVGFLAWMILSRAVIRSGAEKFDDTFAVFWDFACYMVPLIVLQFYLRAKQSGSRAQQQ
jgi:hypothetical protein